MNKTKVAVLGAGGIIGQHMMIDVPPDVEPLYVRNTPSPMADSLNLEDWAATRRWLDMALPDVIINLAGGSRVDVVERWPYSYALVNITLPSHLREWCLLNQKHLVHVSSQAVYGGDRPVCFEDWQTETPVNAYGVQKAQADFLITNGPPECEDGRWTIVRPTFVLGIRPFPAIGRENPAEQLLRGPGDLLQVNNRFFSVSFAWDVAEMLWRVARERPAGKIIHIGNPDRLSRYALAEMLSPGEFQPTTQEALEDLWPIAPRPLDTTYVGAEWGTPLEAGLQRLHDEFADRFQDNLAHRSREVAAFLRRPLEGVRSVLYCGFGTLHNQVSESFRRINPQTDAELLEWYRKTHTYIFELTAYHCDAGFNYAGMCGGIITRLKSHRMPSPWKTPEEIDVTDHTDRSVKRVLCLGDGVGTLSLAMREAGFETVYHDLYRSQTALFARFRHAARFAGEDWQAWLTHSFNPVLAELIERGLFDAICSLDYLEHVPNVEEWARTIYGALKPGGLFIAQNAFAIGSGPEGDMPMHLAVNDRWEKEWDPLLIEVGFTQLSSNWYQKPEAK